MILWLSGLLVVIYGVNICAQRIKLVDIWLDSAVLVQRMGEKIKDRTRISTLIITSVQVYLTCEVIMVESQD